MLERQIDQAERRETLRNDLKVQEESRRVFAPDQSLPRGATTFHQFAVADADIPRGRFTAHERSTVVGSTPATDYPAGPAWSADPGAQCVEPPLGLDNPALELGPLATDEARATGPTSDALSTPLRQRDVGSLSSDDPATEGLAPPSASPRAQRGGAGSSPAFRRRV
jgi:hypothetical protein